MDKLGLMHKDYLHKVAILMLTKNVREQTAEFVEEMNREFSLQ